MEVVGDNANGVKTTLWTEIENSLSLHGIRRIRPKRRTACCSVFWGCFLAAILALMSLYIFQCVQRYLTYSIKWELQPTKHIPDNGPAVTFCNLNQIRISKILEKYPDIMATSGTGPDKHFDWMLFHARAHVLPAREFMLSVGPQMDDFLIGCVCSDGFPCDKANFTTSLTSDGLCYTIVPVRHSSATYDLVFNLESYDTAVHSRHRDTLKVILHRRFRTPSPSDSYFTVTKGASLQFVLTSETFQYLPPPYGSCAEPEISDSCVQECDMEAAVFKCGCLPCWFSPTAASNPKSCSVRDQFSDKCQNMSSADKTSTCSCPKSCLSRVYNTHVIRSSDIDPWHASQSFLARRDSLLHNVKSKSISLEKQSVVIPEDKRVLELSSSGFSDILSGTVKINTTIDQMDNLLSKTMSDIRIRTRFHSSVGILGLQKSLEYGFTSYWDRLEHSYLKYIQVTTKETLANVRRTIENMRSSKIDSANKFVLYSVVDSALAVRLDIAEEILGNLTNLHYAYLRAEPIVSYSLTPNKRYDTNLVPYHLVTRYSDRQTQIYRTFSDAIAAYINTVVELQGHAKDVYQHSRLNSTDFISALQTFSAQADRVKFLSDTFKTEVVYQIKADLTKKKHDFDGIVVNLEESLKRVYSLTQQIREILKLFTNRVVSHAQLHIRLIKWYLDSRNISQSFLLESLCDSSESSVLDEIRDTIIGIELKYHQLIEQSDALQSAYSAVWKSMIDEGALRSFYFQLNSDALQMIRDPTKTDFFMRLFSDATILNAVEYDQSPEGLNKIVTSLNADLPSFENSENGAELMFAILNITSLLNLPLFIFKPCHSAIQHYITTCRRLEKNSQMFSVGDDFVRSNFVHLRFSFSDDHARSWNAVPLYPIKELLVDVAVALFIFLGASVITVVEFVDIMLTRLVTCFHPPTKFPVDDQPPHSTDAAHASRDMNCVTNYPSNEVSRARSLHAKRRWKSREFDPSADIAFEIANSLSSRDNTYIGFNRDVNSSKGSQV